MRLIITSIIVLITVHLSVAQFENEEWKLFKNSEHQFSIEFPNSCVEIITSGEMPNSRKSIYKKNGTLSFGADIKKYSVTFSNKVVPIYSIIIYNNLKETEFATFISNLIIDKGDIYQESDLKFEKIIFGDYNAYKVMYENKIGGYTGLKTVLFISRDKEIIKFEISNVFDNSYDTLYTKIVKTLKVY